MESACNLLGYQSCVLHFKGIQCIVSLVMQRVENLTGLAHNCLDYCSATFKSLNEILFNES